MKHLGVVLLLVLCLARAVAEEGAPFRPQPGQFPPPTEAKSYRGELVFVDHVAVSHLARHVVGEVVLFFKDEGLAADLEMLDDQLVVLGSVHYRLSRGSDLYPVAL